MLSNGLKAPLLLRPTSVAGRFSSLACRRWIEVSHPYGPAPLAGPRALQKPCIAGSRSLRNNQFKAKPLRSSAQRSDLLLAIPGFVVFGALVHILLSVFDESVKQAGELARHGGDGLRRPQTRTQPAILRAGFVLA